jgi:carnitine O-acetyltransferase
MQDPTATPTARRAALAAAAAAHRRQAAECGAGRGIDRHLLGMRVLLGEDGAAMPPIFTDPAFAKSSGWEMSTSNLSHERLQAWGFGEVVEQGFGVGYSILSARLQFFVTCKGSRDAGPSRAEAFKETLQLSLRDMEQLCALQTRAAL